MISVYSVFSVTSSGSSRQTEVLQIRKFVSGEKEKKFYKYQSL